VSAKLRSFHYTAYTHRRGHFDDREIERGSYVEPDMWIELRGAQVYPADPAWWNGETEEPCWDEGCYLADPKTGRMIPGTNMAGRPAEVIIQAWRSGRRICDGVLIFSAPSEKKP
jgi:hypothetical protein